MFLFSCGKLCEIFVKKLLTARADSLPVMVPSSLKVSTEFHGTQYSKKAATGYLFLLLVELKESIIYLINIFQIGIMRQTKWFDFGA